MFSTVNYRPIICRCSHYYYHPKATVNYYHYTPGAKYLKRLEFCKFLNNREQKEQYGKQLF